MQFAPNSAQNPGPNPTHKMNALAPAELIEWVVKQEHEIVNLRRQVAWFQRQIFGQKSERRLPEPDGVQGTLGEAFDAVPDVVPPKPKTRVASHERASKPNKPTDRADESSLFFDDQKVPVEIINVPNLEAVGLAVDDFEVIGEKVTHRLAQRPGSYVILKYVRPVSGWPTGWPRARAIDKFAFHPAAVSPAPAVSGCRDQRQPRVVDAVDASIGIAAGADPCGATGIHPCESGEIHG